MPAFLLLFAGKLGIPEPLRKAAVIAAAIALLIAILAIGKCAYDKSIIANHEQKAALKQVKLERKADSNLQQHKGADQAASEQRQQEMDNATRNIPDAAPSARQRAIACLELRRQAQQRRKHLSAC